MVATILALLAAVVVPRDPAGAESGLITTRVNVASDGTQANLPSDSPATNRDGRFVAFASDANRFASEDTNRTYDIFVHDRPAGTTTRVSVNSNGEGANGRSGSPAISGDGRFVAFESQASNLVDGDTNFVSDIFVHDRDADGDGAYDEAGAIATRRVSVDSAGKPIEGPSSADALAPAISADGRFVVFQSRAPTLVAGDTNAKVDVFVHDRDADAEGPDGVFDEVGAISTTRVSVDSSGAQANNNSSRPAISAGRFVAFESVASNLVIGDANGVSDVFVHDLDTGATTSVSVDSVGLTGNGASDGAAISASGREVAFRSNASNLVLEDPNGTGSDVFVRDRNTDGNEKFDEPGAVATTRVGAGIAAAISADGRFVAFEDSRLNILVHGRGSGTTEEASVTNDGTSAGRSADPAISGDGRAVAFRAGATNLVAGDTNGYDDIFVRAAAPADFSLTASPASQAVVPGNAVKYTLTITPSGAVSGKVELAVSGLPAGASAAFSPNPASSGSTLTVSTATSTAPGTYPLTVAATSGALTRTTMVTLVVSGPDFALDATPESQTVEAGTDTSYTVTITPSGGFAGSVDLAVSGLPAGASAAFSPDPATDSSTLTVSTATTTRAGTYPLTITGTSGALTHTTSVTLVVTEAPDFSLSASPASQTVRRGQKTTYTVTITPNATFTGTVNLAVSGFPKNATAAFDPNPATESSTLTVTTTKQTKTGSFTLKITGTSGSLTRTTTVTVKVTR